MGQLGERSWGRQRLHSAWPHRSVHWFCGVSVAERQMGHRVGEELSCGFVGFTLLV